MVASPREIALHTRARVDILKRIGSGMGGELLTAELDCKLAVKVENSFRREELGDIELGE
jgi:hypothetical protein